MKTKHTQTSIVLFGQVTVEIDGTSKTYDLNEPSAFRDWLESRFDFSRTATSEAVNLELMQKGRYNELGSSQAEDFEYPASLLALVTDEVTLGRAKGKVTPGSIEVIMKLSFGKVNVAGMLGKLETINGYQVVNKKPLPVSDSDGMPVAVKYIVSPLLK